MYAFFSVVNKGSFKKHINFSWAWHGRLAVKVIALHTLESHMSAGSCSGGLGRQ